jgi:hypothetical protein
MGAERQHHRGGRPHGRALVAGWLVNRLLAGSMAVTAACADGGVLLDITSSETPLDALTLTILGRHGALVVEEPVPAGGGELVLPGRLRIDGGERRERLRALAWGWRGGERVAYGATVFDVGPDAGRVVPLRLTGGVPVDSDGDAIPDHEDGCPFVPDPWQEDQDDDGVTDACDGYCPGNLIADPGFDRGIQEWYSYRGTKQIIAGGRDGSGWAAQACTELLDGGTFTLQLQRALVDPPLGARYRVRGWVRAPQDPVQRLAVRLAEIDPADTRVNSAEPSVMSDGEWQLVEVEHTIEMPDPKDLAIYFGSKDAPPETCFELDDVCLRRVE